MKTDFSETHGCPCVIIETGDKFAAVVERAVFDEAFYDDGSPHPLLCVQFPGRQMALYTEDALHRSMTANAVHA